MIFFHGHHRPSALYKEYMKDGQHQPHSQSTSTRWGTQIDWLQNIRRNREIIEKALLHLKEFPKRATFIRVHKQLTTYLEGFDQGE